MYQADSVRTDWRRPFWLALLVASSVAFTLGLACAVPLAAFSAIAAVTLPRRDAILVSLGVWSANQVVGFAFLHYPWDGTCLAWGAVLGATALASMLTARQATRWCGATFWLRPVAAFLMAFATYEAMLYLAALVLGGTEDFSLVIQSRILAINGLAMAGLLLLHGLGTALDIAPVFRPTPAWADGAATAGVAVAAK